MKLDNYLIHNGNLVEQADAVLQTTNRAFLYGDGVFESIRVVYGKACFLETHYQRILEGLKVLKINVPAEFTFSKLEEEVKRVIKKNEVDLGGKVRITLSRKSEGNYLPFANELEYIIEAHNYHLNEFVLNEQGISVDIYPEIKKQINPLSAQKTLNCLLYVMASLYSRDKELDDVLITNDRDLIIESSNSNIFIASNKVLYTPPIEDGCIGGTMRLQIINLALENNMKVYETSLRPQNLLVADELFLTNAIKGIQWVSSYRQKRYFNNVSGYLVDKLNESVRPS